MSANFLPSGSLANRSTRERSSNHKLGSRWLIQKALKDPTYLNQLCDRVYQIMLRDLQQQQRNGNYIGL